MDISRACEQVSALVNPRNVVLVGASERPGSWAGRVWRNLTKYSYPGPIYLVNPGYDEIWGKPCYRDLDSLPEKPDHLIVLVPAKFVPPLLREGAAAGARSATVFSSGFGEAYDKDGEKLGRALRKTLRQTDIAISGPNCMGNICGPSSFVTLTEDRDLSVGSGPVALIGQSGGVMIFLNQALEERGINSSYLITSGNEVGLTSADYIAFLANTPNIKLIIVYIEALKDVARFAAACEEARARGIYVVAVKLGATDAGREAAMAHTGSLAGSLQAFDALAEQLDIFRADTLDDVVELAELLTHAQPVTGRRLGAITLSGAYRGMLLDAAERYGLEFPPLHPESLHSLNKILGVGSLVSNPIDGGFGVLTSQENYLRSVEVLNADPNIDSILLQEALPRAAGSGRAEKYIAMIEEFAATRAVKPISFITPVSHSQTDYSRQLRASAPHMPFLQEANRSLRIIASGARRAERMSNESLSMAVAEKPDKRQKATLDEFGKVLRSKRGQCSLNEYASKSLLKKWNIPFGEEILVRSPAKAVAAARKIGYPVVLKVVSATLTHKSDAGGVILDIRNERSLLAAWKQIRQNVKGHGGHIIDGMLVAKQSKNGIELVLGIHRDPEVGVVIMVGAGGVLLELTQDVAFSMPLNNRKEAVALLDRTRAGKLLRGFRGDRAYDLDAVADAIVSLSDLARQGSKLIESVDINPFVVYPAGEGACALDALVVGSRLR